MSVTDSPRTLAEIVAANPAAARVFEKVGLDYCCHGRVSVEDACRRAGVDPASIEAQLEALPDDGEADWVHLSARALADHIVATHHAYLDEELPLLEALAIKVASVHGTRHPELNELARLVTALRNDLEPHMRKEERVLFPAIHALAGGAREFQFGILANPIRMMEAEHEQAGSLLLAIRTLARGFVVPDDACASFHSLYQRLEALELDTHLHIHKENYALFPAALELAQR